MPKNKSIRTLLKTSRITWHAPPSIACIRTTSLGELVAIFILLVSLVLSPIATGQAQPNSNQLVVDLPPRVEDAIAQGVTISIICQIGGARHNWILKRFDTLDHNSFRIARHVLSKRIIVRNDENPYPHMFNTVAEATRYISQRCLVALQQTEAEQDRVIYYRILLDKKLLPSALRLEALLTQRWNLDSGWIAWNSAS